MFDCRANLEEELDMLRVQAAMDRATVKELRLCLSDEHQGDSYLPYILEACWWSFIRFVKILFYTIYFFVNFFVLQATLSHQGVAAGLKENLREDWMLHL